MHFRKARLLSVRFGHHANFLESARSSDHEVVWHQVAIVEQELNGLPGSDDDDVLVKCHLFKDGANLDDTNTQFAQDRARDFLQLRLRATGWSASNT